MSVFQRLFARHPRLQQWQARAVATPRRRRAWKVAGVLFALWVVLCLAAWLAGPSLVVHYATKYVREEFGHELAIGEVRINPVLLAVTVRNLDLRDPQRRSLVAFRELVVDVDVQTLVRAMVVLDEFSLDGLVLNVERISADRFNFSDLADRLAAQAAAAPAAPAPAAPAAGEDAGPPLHFLIRRTALRDAAFRFVDHTHVPAFESWLRPINLEMEDLTSRPEREAPYDLQATIGSGGTIGWRGDLTLQPLSSKGRLELRRFGLKAAHEYMQSQFAFALPAGTLDVGVDYLADFSGAQGVLRITDGSVSIDALEIADAAGNPLFAFERTEATGIVADLVQSTLAVKRVETRGGRIEAVIEADGSTNIQRALLPPPAAAVAAVEPPAAPSPQPAATPAATPATPPATPVWNIAIASAAIRDYRLHLVDRSVQPAVDLTLQDVTFEATGLRLPEPAPVPFRLAASAASGGALGIEGEYGLADGALRADISLEGLEVAPFSPYLGSIGRISLPSGRVTWKGKVAALDNGTRDLRVEGSGSLRGVTVLDEVRKQRLARLGELALDGLVYEDRVPRLALRRVTVAGLDVDVALDRNGVSNVERVFAPSPAAGAAGSAVAATPAAPPAAAAPAARPMAMRIDSLVLRDNAFGFRDDSPDLSFATRLAGFGGRIDGLSTDPAKRASVALNGTIDRYAPLEIRGEVNPLAAVSYTDLQVRLSSLDLSALTPYTVTYIAYPLERGKLGVELDWKIQDRRFESKNRALIDGLALGEKREAPRATRLPVKLGIALLTNREGDADLEVPAYGELDDPKFRIGKVILAALGNLITRAATAPFAALGGLGGGEDKAGQVGFPAGGTEPAEGEAARLARISTVLADRPLLSVAITGTAAADLDREALRRARLEDALKREYLDSPFRRGRALEEVTLSPEQRADLLATLYAQRTGRRLADLRDAAGNPLAPAAQQEAATAELLAGIAVDDGQLRELARARAARVKDLLLAAGLPEARLFVVDGEILPQAAGLVPSRLALEAR